MVASAMILAAGRGERMRPLTDRTPKPLLRVGRWRLIEWHLWALARAGVSEVVINTAWLEQLFPALLGNGERYGVRIHWSFERAGHGGPLETAGGIRTCLPLLGEHFWVVAGDVFLPEFAFEHAHGRRFAAGSSLAHLWLVANPAHHPVGDFGLSGDGQLVRAASSQLTWASVGLFRAELFSGLPLGQRAPLRPLLDAAADAGRLTGECLDGCWIDVGTPERLALARSWWRQSDYGQSR